MLFGDVPAQWVRLVVLGAFIAWVSLSVSQFRQDVREESQAVRRALSEYIAANKAWQDLTMAQRTKLVNQVDRRFGRLYRTNGWEYENLVP
jgi:hypothetical protein